VNAEIALPRGYSLQEYRIESTLGIGGFGLTYLATDSNLNVKVAIKEYLPGDLALRGDDQSVRSKSDMTLDTFNWGRSRFLDESRTLASFRHANIVRVMRFFEANETAYMVMEFVDGQPLNEWIKNRRPIPEPQLTAIAVPLLDGLGMIHRAGYLHRDIKPGNVFLRHDGSPVLLDFGSARVATADTERTAIVTPGYAPLEQYHVHGNQGPWTDLYALGAVLYWIVTGDKPMEATARVPKDPMKTAVDAGDRSRYSLELLKAIDWALAPAETARPQSVDQLRSALQNTAHDAVADLKTIFVDKTLRSSPAVSQPSQPASAMFDSEMLKKMSAELARHIGPIAAMVVKAAARKATTVMQLAEKVAMEIADAKARALFVKKFSSDEKSKPAAEPSRPSHATSQPSLLMSAQPRFEPAMLTKAEHELARYIGAVARAIVRRTAAKARDESEFYAILAAEIEDPADKKSFIRKTMSTSGRE
jgi:serine/threonine protein kinase